MDDSMSIEMYVQRTVRKTDTLTSFVLIGSSGMNSDRSSVLSISKMTTSILRGPMTKMLIINFRVKSKLRQIERTRQTENSKVF